MSVIETMRSKAYNELVAPTLNVPVENIKHSTMVLNKDGLTLYFTENSKGKVANIKVDRKKLFSNTLRDTSMTEHSRNIVIR